jgi:hypothetical protein
MNVELSIIVNLENAIKRKDVVGALFCLEQIKRRVHIGENVIKG